MGETLRREEILRNRRDLDSVRRTGRRLPGPVLYLRYSPSVSPDTEQSTAPARRVGFMLTRGIRGAVRRNRLKRRMREIYRTNKDWFPVGQDYLLYASPEAAEMDYAALYREAETLAAGLRDDFHRP